MSLLDIRDLSVTIGGTAILRDVSLGLDPGEILAITGESGSGKSMTALAVMQLLPPASDLTGHITLDGTCLTDLAETDLCAIRGNDIGMVFQEPMTALNPVQTIGAQVAETIRIHTDTSPRCRAGKGRRNPCAGRFAPGALSARALPARAVGRPAPARRHRHGHRPASKAADCG